MVVLGLANIRLKDFYDIAVIARRTSLEGALLARAIRATFERRATPLPLRLPVGLTAEFGDSASKRQQWQGFLRKSRLADAELGETVALIASLLWPPTQVAVAGSPATAVWDASRLRWLPHASQAPNATHRGGDARSPHAEAEQMTLLKPETPPRLFKSAKAFEAWLKKHHATSDGLWLQIAKKGAEEPSVTYAEAVDLALCFGWIDGQKKGQDDQHFLQRFTPRRPKSVWSKINIGKVATLIEAGRMQPAGQAQVDAAKADGRWTRAYDGARTSTVPDDLQEALDATPAAKKFFATINATNRYAVLWRVQTAVKPETRAKRIAQLVEMLARGEVVHIFKPKVKA